MSTELPQAGWYPNPDGTGGLRWWSGVGWTEYTREGVAPQPPAEEPGQTQVLGPGWGESPATPTAAWGQPAAPTAPLGGYAPYYPPAEQPLAPSGMRKLNGMFGDIGRIARRAWLPILGISLVIWALVSAVVLGISRAFVNWGALERALNLTSSSTSPETGAPVIDSEISAAFRDAFEALSPAGWVVVGGLLTLLFLVATAVQMAAVSRLGMDAAAQQPVSWGAGWKSGLSAGMRLFGYFLLISVVTMVAWSVVIGATVALWTVSPGGAVFLGFFAVLALVILSIWIGIRLVVVTCQAVIGPRALRWSWTHTRGKFWPVLGRYLLWSLAAGVIVNVIVTVITIPLSLIVVGTAGTTSNDLGTSLLLSLLTMPVSGALTAVTLIGIVPIWRDLTDHPAYRSIDEAGLPIQNRS